MLNSGSFLIIQALLVGKLFTLLLINKICVYLSKYKLARQIGLKVYRKSPGQSLRDDSSRLFIEYYIELVLASFLQ